MRVLFILIILVINAYTVLSQEKIIYFKTSEDVYKMMEHNISDGTEVLLFNFDEYPSQFIYNHENLKGYYIYNNFLVEINTEDQSQKLLSDKIPFNDDISRMDLYLDRFTNKLRVCFIEYISRGTTSHTLRGKIRIKDPIFKVFEIDNNEMIEIESHYVQCNRYTSRCDLVEIYKRLYPMKIYKNWIKSSEESLKIEQFRNPGVYRLKDDKLNVVKLDNSIYFDNANDENEGKLNCHYTSLPNSNERYLIYTTRNFDEIVVDSPLLFLVDDEFVTLKIIDVKNQAFSISEEFVMFYDVYVETWGSTRMQQNRPIKIFDHNLNLVKQISGSNAIFYD